MENDNRLRCMGQWIEEELVNRNRGFGQTSDGEKDRAR